MKREIVIVNDFYKHPAAVVRYAMGLRYYNPYANDWQGGSASESMAGATWRTSFFKRAVECPFKSSEALVRTLERITGEKIDREYWNRDYPEDPSTGAITGENLRPYLKDPDGPRSFHNARVEEIGARWNCAFNVKHAPSRLGEGVHNHAIDLWNYVGEDGWTGLVYLNEDAPRDAGLKLMRNKYGNNLEKFTGADRWELVDDLGNVYNRLLLVRGSYPHTGGPGFGSTLEDGRLFQTFFFRTKDPEIYESIDIAV